VDGERLARVRDYNAQPVEAALEAFARSRAASMARLRAISERDLDRTASSKASAKSRFEHSSSAGWNTAGHIADMEALRRGGAGRTTASTA
jgi:hypothetical protein